MSPKERVYSNRLMTSWLQHLDERLGQEKTDALLERNGLNRMKLADFSGFMTAEENTAFVLDAMRETGDDDLSYHMGRDFPKYAGKLQGFVIGITTPDFLIKNLGAIEGKLALKTLNETRKIGRDKYRVDISFRDGFHEQDFVCRNRVGMYESMPLFFGLPYARVEHEECAFKGGSRCVYTIHFPSFGFTTLKRLYQISLPLAVGACAHALWARDARTGYAAAGVALAGMLAYSIYRGVVGRKTLQWALLMNQGLTQQNRLLENSNVQVQSLQKLTNGLNAVTEVAKVCEAVVMALVRDFGFGSSQIWLLDDKGEYLACRKAEGYGPDLQAFISHTRFKMGENWDNPFGLLVQTLEQRQTLIINEPETLYPKLTPQTREFLRALNLSSFIITPLFHEERPLGILAAEYHEGEKLENQSKLFFQSISNSVANALVKAQLFEQMAQKIEERTRALEEASKKLLAAQEMAIQSEKLSSLGQMAAGVAHEINNPLNFLVNILPEVRRDMEGLEKIRALALTGGLNEAQIKAIEAVERDFDLESHLAEKDFVFDKIKKALDKSTRIAQSLKVFSRSSAKERIAPEPLAAMVRDVIELLPQQVRGDTRIDVDIPDQVTLSVNKNEMEQAFLALINNAIDAMGQKGRIEIACRENGGERVLTFRDYGPGIPESALKKIFDPFYTTKPPGKGTGLGLTIATEIVKKYGGVLTVDSKIGEGATFILTFR